MTAKQSPPTTLSEERLLPCPFCGKQPRSRWHNCDTPGSEDCGFWGIDCCLAHAHGDSEDEAMELWNKRNEVEQMARYQWQPIESAPRDGTHFLASHTRVPATVEEVWFNKTPQLSDYPWTNGIGSFIDGFFTHWWPIPLPPAPEKQEGGAA